MLTYHILFIVCKQLTNNGKMPHNTDIFLCVSKHNEWDNNGSFLILYSFFLFAIFSATKHRKMSANKHIFLNPILFSKSVKRLHSLLFGCGGLYVCVFVCVHLCMCLFRAQTIEG